MSTYLKYRLRSLLVSGQFRKENRRLNREEGIGNIKETGYEAARIYKQFDFIITSIQCCEPSQHI